MSTLFFIRDEIAQKGNMRRLRTFSSFISSTIIHPSTTKTLVHTIKSNRRCDWDMATELQGQAPSSCIIAYTVVQQVWCQRARGGIAHAKYHALFHLTCCILLCIYLASRPALRRSACVRCDRVANDWGAIIPVPQERERERESSYVYSYSIMEGNCILWNHGTREIPSWKLEYKKW